MKAIRIIIQVGDHGGDIYSGLIFKPIFAEAMVIKSLNVTKELADRDYMMKHLSICYDALKRRVDHNEKMKAFAVM